MTAPKITHRSTSIERVEVYDIEAAEPLTTPFATVLTALPTFLPEWLRVTFEDERFSTAYVAGRLIRRDGSLGRNTSDRIYHRTDRDEMPDWLVPLTDPGYAAGSVS
jgi:hypothetical protein